jgi:hypothetical protein
MEPWRDKSKDIYNPKGSISRHNVHDSELAFVASFDRSDHEGLGTTETKMTGGGHKVECESRNTINNHGMSSSNYDLTLKENNMFLYWLLCIPSKSLISRP